MDQSGKDRFEHAGDTVIPGAGGRGATHGVALRRTAAEDMATGDDDGVDELPWHIYIGDRNMVWNGPSGGTTTRSSATRLPVILCPSSARSRPRRARGATAQDKREPRRRQPTSWPRPRDERRSSGERRLPKVRHCVESGQVRDPPFWGGARTRKSSSGRGRGRTAAGRVLSKIKALDEGDFVE